MKLTIFNIDKSPISLKVRTVCSNLALDNTLLALKRPSISCSPGVGSMGKSMDFMGRPWFPHAPHASLMLSHALQKHGEAREAWEYFSGHISRAWISTETMGHHLLVILSSMEKHGKHGTLFSHDFRQHGKAW